MNISLTDIMINIILPSLTAGILVPIITKWLKKKNWIKD